MARSKWISSCKFSQKSQKRQSSVLLKYLKFPDKNGSICPEADKKTFDIRSVDDYVRLKA